MSFVLCMILVIVLTACKQKEPEVAEVKIDLLNDEFPEAQQAVKMTMDSIAQSIKDGDIERLISWHAYNPKFTEFKNGELRNDGAANEEFERSIFGGVTEVVKFDFNDMKIAVFGDVANVTFHSDFQLQFGEDLAVVNDQITLLFLKTKKGWRIVHEHHSPIVMTEE